MDITLSLSVVMPLCVYMAVGAIAKRFGLLDDHTISKMNGITYKVLFPMVMFSNMLNAGDAIKSSGTSVIPFLLACVAVVFILLMVFVPFFIKEKPRQASFIQGSFRANSVLFAIPIVSAICGEDNTGLAAMSVSVVVPFYNALSVILLEIKRGGHLSVWKIVKGIVTNPLIVGAFVGLLFLLTGIPLPEMLRIPVSAMSSMVTPLALMLLGASLKFAGIKKDAACLGAVCALKLVVMPAITILLARMFNYEGVAFVTIFALFCVPTAVSSYTMAEQMGADGPLAAEIVAATTVCSMLTVFMWVLALSAMRLI